MKPFDYMRLTRLDVTLIAFFSYLIGGKLVSPLKIEDGFVAAAIAFISTNSIYSLNAWADRDIDRVNSPDRPVASGRIPAAHALRYALVMLVLSVTYPWFIATSYIALGLFLLLPLLGVLYSVPQVYLKRNAPAAVLVTSTGLLVPILLGYVMHGGSGANAAFFVMLYVFCLSVVPLKDITDVDGDTRAGIDNLYHRYGRRLLIVCLLGLTVDAVLLSLLPLRTDLKVFMGVLIMSSSLSVIVYGNKLNRLYAAIIRLTVFAGAILCASLVF
jgi:4-hydroxybenzoate polyprenyltransferase